MNTFLPADSFVGLLVPNAIDASLCASLLNDVVARGFSSTGLRYPGEYRNNDRLVFDDPSLAQELFTLLGEELPPTMVVDGVSWVLEGLNSRFRACRYQDGQGFCIHRDGPHIPSDELRSLLTVQLYLDDARDRVGGHTRFYSDARGTTTWASIPPASGTAIMFDHRVWHDGESVTAGIKHVLRTDAMYRAFEPPAAARGLCKVPLSKNANASHEVVGRHRGYAWKVIVRANGDIASAGRDGTVRTWGKSPRVTDLGRGSVTALHEVDGTLWAGTRSGTLVIVEGQGALPPVADVGGTVLSITHLPALDVSNHEPVSRAAIVVASTASGELFAADKSGGPMWKNQAHEGWAWCVTPYRDGLVSMGEDGRIRFTTPAGQTNTLAELGQPLRTAAARGEEIWVGDMSGGLHMLKDNRLVLSLDAHEAAITSICIAKDGMVISGSEDGCVKWWRDGVSIRCAASLDFVTSVGLNARDEVVCAGYDGVIRVLR